MAPISGPVFAEVNGNVISSADIWPFKVLTSDRRKLTEP